MTSSVNNVNILPHPHPTFTFCRYKLWKSCERSLASSQRSEGNTEAHEAAQRHID